MPSLGLNCYACPLANFACPIGTLQYFAIIHEVPFYTLGVLGIAGALFGRMACGWLCPFGLLQEMLYKIKIPKFIKSRRPAESAASFAEGGIRECPTPHNRNLLKLHLSHKPSWIRYFVLIFLVGALPFLTGEPWFSKLCPVGTIQAAIPLILIDARLRTRISLLFPLKVAILLFFLIWMVVSKRPFCRFVCPLGAIWSPFNRHSALLLDVDEERCTRCELCFEVCPMDIMVYEGPNSSQCIRCLECAKVCPVGAIAFKPVRV